MSETNQKRDQFLDPSQTNGHSDNQIDDDGIRSRKERRRRTKPLQSGTELGPRVLITGGAGFIGVNLADHFLRAGYQVTILDNLSRKGVKTNLSWLMKNSPPRLQVEIGDIRDQQLTARLVDRSDAIFHLAAQVAVTTSFDQPRDDFEVNIGGTFSLLEQASRRENPPFFLFTSTNKVYGDLQQLPLVEGPSRYEPLSAKKGIDECFPLDFLSPYGCSKGAADQYVLDFARSFRVPSVVFRMSCIYGFHQCGNEDQGWVAHFLIQALKERPITIFGDGKQVRDILFVTDLIRAMDLAWANAPALFGQAFNIGGGPGQSVSLVELIDLIGRRMGKKAPVQFQNWRPGDQRYYVSDTTKFKKSTGWQPAVSCEEGIHQLLSWFQQGEKKAALTENSFLSGK